MTTLAPSGYIVPSDDGVAAMQGMEELVATDTVMRFNERVQTPSWLVAEVAEAVWNGHREGM